MERKFDKIPKEIQKKCIAEVITRVEEIDNDDVGVIAAQDIIDIIMENYGSEIYNMGLRDAKKLLDERLSDIETEMLLLEQ